uniref:Uncharacterized protein n=1 Tax=Chromera velia CCMP2878 TaxID=1169474 RepID=A0A0G4GWZ7_9ALVE|eukprot:Cvel_23732.t1-p1 / transcript=Cvel_23732.t1 / gene=Cvel_23732 / organism=Chromera_velia_CCMP2878 / gene_product=Staphylococcal nuclease domain-containing protein 1, putative / transcript_product=Staphylococcal nuclease domain-containing protein 1, putative / location=Cvel_scaffold2482:8455-13831(+) / protein_length=936 / sequence_SO=supercontig / SO=protein_coding / is_pseudo=false
MSKATVKEVKSGDTLVVMGVPKGGPPPEKEIRLSSLIAPRIAMKSLTKEVADEPYGYEAREFLRKKLVGKPVEFKVDYQFQGKDYATVSFEGNSISYELLKAGFAKVKSNPNPPNAPDYEQLKATQEEAEAAKVGIFSEDAAGHVRTITWTSSNPDFAKSFVEKHKGKKLPAVIEYVRDGAHIRAFFPGPSVYSTILLSGIQVDTFKKAADDPTKINAEPFAAEAKYFVESRLLNRDVEVRVEGCDDFGNILGSVYHPNGQIALLLLKNGLAKVVDGSARLTESPLHLREAMKEAQAKRLRKWKNWQPAQISGAKEYAGKVVEVVSGDVLMVQDLTVTGQRVERRLYLASIRCPRLGGGKKEDEAYAWDAKEFARKKVAGKKVKVVVEYMREATPSATGNLPPPPSDSSGKMHFVTIMFNEEKQNLNETLVTQGLAKTLPHRVDDERAANYDLMVELEKAASDKKIGVHGPEKAAPKHKINDLMGPANASRAKAFESSLARQPRLEAVVEHVFNAGRFKLRVPSENISISFVLGGIRVPQTAKKEGALGKGPKTSDPFAEEALAYVRDMVIQQDVVFKVDVCDKGGNFIGSMWKPRAGVTAAQAAKAKNPTQGAGEGNLAAELLELGYAMTVEFSLNQNPFRDALLAAEKKAQDAKMRVWSLPETTQANGDAGPAPEKAVDRNVDESLGPVVISHIEGITRFFVQREADGKALEELQNTLNEKCADDNAFKLPSAPRKGELVAARFSVDKQWYRARVENRSTGGSSFTVFFLDYGNTETLSSQDLKQLPPPLTPVLQGGTAFCKSCKLSGVLEAPEFERDAFNHFASLVDEKRLACKVEKIEAGGTLHVVLEGEEEAATPSHGASHKSINEALVRQGLARLNKKSDSKIFARLKKEEEAARKEHLNVWRHGDVGDDDDDDDFPPFNPRAAANGAKK